MAENTQLAEQKKEVAVKPFKEALTESLADAQMALPENFNVTRFVLNCDSILRENETLSKFIKSHPGDGIIQAKKGMLKGAFLGLDFMQSEAYLIPYGDTLTFMPSYTGKVKLCKRYSTRPIRDIYSRIVREGDELIEKVVDGKPSIDFIPKPFNTRDIIGAFAVVIYQDGGIDYETMSIGELEQVRKSSKMGTTGAWKAYTSEMYRKTVLRRLTKHIDLNFDSSEQAQYFNEDTDIETDVRTQAEAEIAENANMIPFDDEVIEGNA